MAAPVTTAKAAEVADKGPGAMQRVFGALGDNPHYRSYWFGNQANTLVMQMQQVANGYLAYTLTDSAAALGVVAFAQSAPMLVFSPLGTEVPKGWEGGFAIRASRAPTPIFVTIICKRQ